MVGWAGMRGAVSLAAVPGPAPVVPPAGPGGLPHLRGHRGHAGRPGPHPAAPHPPARPGDTGRTGRGPGGRGAAPADGAGPVPPRGPDAGASGSPTRWWTGSASGTSPSWPGSTAGSRLIGRRDRRRTVPTGTAPPARGQPWALRGRASSCAKLVIAAERDELDQVVARRKVSERVADGGAGRARHRRDHHAALSPSASRAVRRPARRGRCRAPPREAPCRYRLLCDAPGFPCGAGWDLGPAGSPGGCLAGIRQVVQRAASAASHLQGPETLTAQLDHLLSLVRHMVASRGTRCRVSGRPARSPWAAPTDRIGRDSLRTYVRRPDGPPARPTPGGRSGPGVPDRSPWPCWPSAPGPSRPAGPASCRWLPPLAGLLPDGGLRRGSTIVVSGPGGTGRAERGVSVALALVAAASGAGVVVRAGRADGPRGRGRPRPRRRPGPAGRGPPTRGGLGRGRRRGGRRGRPGGALPPVPTPSGHGPPAGGPGPGTPGRAGGGAGPGRVARATRPAPEHRRHALGRCRNRRGLPLPAADDGDGHRAPVGGPPPAPPAVAASAPTGRSADAGRAGRPGARL